MTLLLVALASVSFAQTAPVRYTVDFDPQPTTHMLHISLEVSGVKASTFDVALNASNATLALKSSTDAAPTMLNMEIVGSNPTATAQGQQVLPGVTNYLGGPGATFSVEEAIPKVVDVLLAQKGRPGLQYLDREGRTVPW